MPGYEPDQQPEKRHSTAKLRSRFDATHPVTTAVSSGKIRVPTLRPDFPLWVSAGAFGDLDAFGWFALGG
jgi:hypothetical protein